MGGGECLKRTEKSEEKGWGWRRARRKKGELDVGAAGTGAADSGGLRSKGN